MEIDSAAAIHNLHSIDQKQPTHVLIGFDAAIDKIMDVVDKRTGWDSYQRILTIPAYAARIRRAAGLSTNLEMVPKTIKTGGCAVNTSNALLNLGASVDFVGTVGERFDPIFRELASRCREFISIGEPSYAQALEFDDGKIIMAELAPMQEVTWGKLEGHLPVERQVELYGGADVIAMVNWTETPHMNQIWRSLLDHVFPKLPKAKQRLIFFDLADPEKRPRGELEAGLRLIEEFREFGTVVLGLNRKEATHVGDVLRVKCSSPLGEASLEEITMAIAKNLCVQGVAVHPVWGAGIVLHDEYVEVKGPFTPHPRLVTGAGDNFNAGLIYGLSLGLSPHEALTLAVGTSGFYVRNMKSPTLAELLGFLAQCKAGELDL